MKILEKIKAKQANPAGAEPITLAFIGDSVTQGCYELYKTGDRSFMAEFRVEQTYHNKLRHILELCYPQVPFNMIYAGINGNNTTSGLSRLDRDVIAFHPDLTVVCYGLNDCVSGMDNLEKYKENLRQIFAKLKLPASLEPFFSGLKVSASYAVVGAVISEWLGGFEGLGVYMTRVKKAYAFDKKFAVILLVSAVSLLLMAAVALLKRLCMPYKNKK